MNVNGSFKGMNGKMVEKTVSPLMVSMSEMIEKKRKVAEMSHEVMREEGKGR